MPTKPAAKDQPIQVVDGPNYKRDIAKHPHADKDVQKVLTDIVLPALRANSILPHLHGAGTPINHGIFSARVPNSAEASGKRGGFRFQYHWDRQKRTVTKLSLTVRRDANSLIEKALKTLIAETTTPKKN
jgi:mRNA-degrading endonuclease RelE of RelBE toxin-antitoxin system